MKNKYSALINELSDKELLFHLYSTQILLLIISIISGKIVFEEFPSFLSIDWTDWNILFYGITGGLAVVFVDWILMKRLPPSYYDDGGLNERIFQRRSVPHIAFIAMVVAISEEMLFRGIIQTKLGIIPASLIFAVIHYRYLFNKFLFLNIILLSFVIGLVYNLTNNLAVTIVMHFLIDFLLGLLIRQKRLKYNDKQEGE